MFCVFCVALGVEIIADVTTVFCVSKRRTGRRSFTFYERMLEFGNNIAFEKITAGAEIQSIAFGVTGWLKSVLGIRVILLGGYIGYIGIIAGVAEMKSVSFFCTSRKDGLY